MASIAQEHTLFEIDRELDTLLDEIEEEIENRGEASAELVDRFQQFCEAHGEKADRIGRFLRMMEAREQSCRSEAVRLSDRARAAAGKMERTKNMVLYYLLSRDLKKVEGHQLTLFAQKSGQDSVRIIDEAAVPKCYCKIEARIAGVVWETVLSLLPDELAKALESSIQETRPDNDAIKAGGSAKLGGAGRASAARMACKSGLNPRQSALHQSANKTNPHQRPYVRIRLRLIRRGSKCRSGNWVGLLLHPEHISGCRPPGARPVM